MIFKAFTVNRKTILSVDFDRMNTCPQICSYCYVNTTEKIYSGYLQKIKRNNQWALNNPEEFADTLNKEYSKVETSRKFDKLKLPIRLYGSGDFIPVHYKFISKLNFPFYMISKSLTMKYMTSFIPVLLELENLTSIVLSFDKDNISNYENVKEWFGKDRIKFSYTGLYEEYVNLQDYKFNIFFNIKKNKAEISKARLIKEQCPCDTKLIKSEKACTICNKCWRSTRSKKMGF